MPIPVLRARVAVVGLALAATMSLASVADAKTIPAELRVVDSDGTDLAEQTQYTAKEGIKIKTDPGTKCFIGGAGGSGDKVTVPGPTAFSLLADAGETTRDVRPLSVTDEFPFGLGLCGVGDAVATTDGFWYLKADHTAAQVGGDQLKVKPGLDVLWYLIEDASQPPPDELVMTTPNVKAGVDAFEVQVFSYTDAGKKKPAKGAEVTGAKESTDAKGVTLVEVGDSDLIELTATREGAIPSNDETVCTVKAAKCPPGYAETIAGTGGDDEIETGKSAETVLAGGGDDRIDGSGGAAPDLVKCGGGDDKVTGYDKSGDTRFAGCEKVR